MSENDKFTWEAGDVQFVDLPAEPIRVGQRVRAGTAEDQDSGYVHNVRDGSALVAWSSGVRTWTPVADLEVL